MTDTTPALLSTHIRARLAKSTLDSPAINISKAGWEVILAVLDDPALSGPWAGWQPIGNLLEADLAEAFEGLRAGELLLWNPCDGLNTEWRLSIPEIWALGQRGIYSHWRFPPKRPGP